MNEPEPIPVNPKKRAGRKDMRKDPDVMKRLEDALVAGNTYRVACIMAGIAERTFFNWMARAQNSERAIDRQFLQLVKNAEVQAIHRNVMVIQKAAAKNWTASAWWLERRCPEEWGRKDFVRNEHVGSGGGPVQTANTNTNLNLNYIQPPMSEAERREILKRTYERTFGLPHDQPAGDPDRSAAGPAGDPGQAEPPAAT